MNSTAWKTSLTSDSTTAQETLGALRVEDSLEGTKEYRYVLSATTLVVGDVVIPATATGGWKVTSTIPNVDDGIMPFGVASAVITAGGYGWVQTKGYHGTVKVAGATDTSAAIGKHLYAVKNTTGTAAIYTAATVNSAATASNVISRLGVCAANGGASVAAIAAYITCSV